MAQLEVARKEIEKRARERAAAQQEEYKSKVAERQARRDHDATVRGREPVAPDETPRGKGRYNFKRLHALFYGTTRGEVCPAVAKRT